MTVVVGAKKKEPEKAKAKEKEPEKKATKKTGGK